MRSNLSCFVFCLRSVFIFLAAALFSTGCSQPVRTLKALGDEQGAQAHYVKSQERLFDRLLEDIKSGNLREGAKHQRILERYGYPVLTLPPTPEQEQKGVVAVALYRPAVKFFGAAKIYLGFNKEDFLCEILLEE